MKVKLKTPHTHAGEKLLPGAEIEVSDVERGWLEENGVIEASPAAPASLAAPANRNSTEG